MGPPPRAHFFLIRDPNRDSPKDVRLVTSEPDMRGDCRNAAGNWRFGEILGGELHIRCGFCTEQKLGKHKRFIQSRRDPTACQPIPEIT